MQFALQCPCCRQHFDLAAFAATEAFDPYAAMEDGQTVEDWLSNQLAPEGTVECSCCGQNTPVSEGELSTLALEVLASW